jgi:hypothetical protein
MRDYRHALDGFTVGEIISFKGMPETRWKIAKLWVKQWFGRTLHLSSLICTYPGVSPGHRRKVGTGKDGTATSWLVKVPKEGT